MDPCRNPGDVDGDGVVDFMDLLLVLSGWTQGPVPQSVTDCLTMTGSIYKQIACIEAIMAQQ